MKGKSHCNGKDSVFESINAFICIEKQKVQK